MNRHFLVFSSIILLPSCSLVGDAVDITNRRSREVSKGTSIGGIGFTVKAPEEGLYPIPNTPGKGGVTFRPTEPMFDGLVYFVTPFPQSKATTVREALIEWNQIPAAKGVQVKIIGQKETQYRRYPAIEALVEVPQNNGGQIASILIVRSPAGFFVLNRGDVFYQPQDRTRAIERCKAGLNLLKASTTIQDG